MESYAIELRTMTSLSSYRELIVWQKSMDLTVRIYALTRCFPAAERYGIHHLGTSQMRRSASSIPANIAEGQARRSTGEFVQSLGVARGSLAELETFLTLSTKLEMTTPEQCRCLLNDCAEISKMLNALIKSLSTLHSPLDRGVCSVAWCCAGLSSGTGNLPDIVNKAGNDNARAMQVHSPLNASNHSPLSTLHSPLSTLHSPLITLH